MDDEAHPLPAPSDKEHASMLQPGNVHPLSKNHLSPTTFSRFVQKIGQIFARTPSNNEVKLSGRIQELQTMAERVFSELVAFKKEIKEKVDVELFSLVVVFLDPLMKETGRAPPVIEKEDNTVHQVKVFSRYVESIEKAKSWVKIGKEYSSREELERAIIHHAATEFLLRIDRDIQVIQDYLNCALSDVKKTEAIKNKLSEYLMPDLTSKIAELDQLKALPEEWSLQSFMQWRVDADEAREGYFSDALHMIDSFSDEFLVPGKKRTSVNPQSDEVMETEF